MLEICEEILVNCSGLARQLTSIIPKYSLFPNVPLNTQKDLTVYCAILAIIAFVVRIIDGIRDEERKYFTKNGKNVS